MPHIFAYVLNKTRLLANCLMHQTRLWNLTYLLLTYLRTPWSRVLEKITGSKLVKNSAHLMEPESSLPRYKYPPTVPIASQIDPFHAPHPTFSRSILILSSHLQLGTSKWSLSLR